eukprot:TRINITY_DN5075_c0_g1_i3.p1 TRINITY_DN5075_c0_g1~~TRINITY_DN5075_c0_g1_i3.p1  ORF type:complete len:238 (+),score=33.78 TRINITY_DN5075_c0_g1_i3:192-905(+)
MKGIDLFCASPASTAICVSMDHRSMVCSGSRAIDRHNPHLLDRRRIKPPSPCPQSPSNPRSYHQKNTKSSAKQIELASPPGSTRYLLSDSPFLDASSLEFDPVQAPSLVPVETVSSRCIEEDYFDPVSALIRMETTKSRSIKEDKLSIIKSSSTRSQEQVVVLKVSLHCKGCEHKVRKHISRMQGVKSFNIDFPAKKVTVIGNVTPLGVLTSISKVKKAQFWPSSAPSSSSSSSSVS